MPKLLKGENSYPLLPIEYSNIIPTNGSHCNSFPLKAFPPPNLFSKTNLDHGYYLPASLQQSAITWVALFGISNSPMNRTREKQNISYNMIKTLTELEALPIHPQRKPRPPIRVSMLIQANLPPIRIRAFVKCSNPLRPAEIQPQTINLGRFGPAVSTCATCR